MELPYFNVDLPIWMILSTILIILIYLYGTWPYTYFSSLGIPGPKPLPFIGNFMDYFTKTEMENYGNWVKQYGKIYGYYTGRQPVLSIHDPKIIEDILIKDFPKFVNREIDVPLNAPMEKSIIFLENNEWRTMRNAILPTFTSGQMKQYFGAIKDCGGRLETLIGQASKREEIKDTKTLFGCYALEVISATAFGIKVDAQNDKSDPVLTAIIKMFEHAIPVSYLIYKILPLFKPITNVLGMRLWPTKSVNFFRKYTNNMLEVRKTNGQGHKDFMQILIDCKKVDSENEDKLRDLTNDEICSQAILFFLAGFETTASLMTFAIYSLARNPEIQEKCYAEIMEHAGDGDLTYETLGELKYLTQCMYETLRIYTPVMSMSRVAKEDVVLGGFRVPRGTVINLPYQYIHMDPEIYPDPYTFDPDRFAPEKRTEKKSTYLAFGVGPRMCIGNRLALLEAKVAIVCTLRKYVLLKPKTETELKFKPGPLLFSTEHLNVQVKARQP